MSTTNRQVDLMARVAESAELERRGVFRKASPSEFRVLALKANHFTGQQIAAALDISVKTVATYTDRARSAVGGLDSDGHANLSTQEAIWAFYDEYGWPASKLQTEAVSFC